MNKYGYENEKMHELFFKVLDGYKHPDEDETLYGIMSQIQDFFDSCYWIGINPLREIRQILPQYKWRFHRSIDRGLIRNVIAGSQLIWRVNWTDDDHLGWAKEIQLVTAIKIDTVFNQPERLFFAGDKKKLERSTDKLRFVKEFCGDPVYADILDEAWMRTPAGQKWLHTPILKTK